MGIEDGEYRAEKIDFWDSVYGFNMSCIKKIAMMVRSGGGGRGGLLGQRVRLQHELH